MRKVIMLMLLLLLLLSASANAEVDVTGTWYARIYTEDINERYQRGPADLLGLRRCLTLNEDQSFQLELEEDEISKTEAGRWEKEKIDDRNYIKLFVNEEVKKVLVQHRDEEVLVDYLALGDEGAVYLLYYQDRPYISRPSPIKVDDIDTFVGNWEATNILVGDYFFSVADRDYCFPDSIEHSFLSVDDESVSAIIEHNQDQIEYDSPTLLVDGELIVMNENEKGLMSRHGVIRAMDNGMLSFAWYGNDNNLLCTFYYTRIE